MALAERAEQKKKRSVIQMSTAESKASIAELQRHEVKAKVDAELQRHAKKAKVGAELQRHGEKLAKVAGPQRPAEKAKVGAVSQLRHGEKLAQVAEPLRPAERVKVAEPRRPAEKAKVDAESQLRHGEKLAQVAAAELKRHTKPANLRLYVRSSTHKLRWTQELHGSFMDAVNELGGQIRATPKQILGRMGRDDVTIAQVKSHLQMLRLGKINAEGIPVTAELVDPAVLSPIVVSKAVKPSRVSRIKLDALDPPERLSVKEQREVFTALQLLKTGKIIPGSDEAQKLLQGLMDFDHFVCRAPNSDVRSVPAHEFIPVGDSLRGENRKAPEDDIALDLSIGTYVRSPEPTPMFRFPCPDTAAESRLSLELAL